ALPIYDLYYIKHTSLWLDLLILFDTVKIVLLGRESVPDAHKTELERRDPVPVAVSVPVPVPVPDRAAAEGVVLEAVQSVAALLAREPDTSSRAIDGLKAN